MQSNSGEEARQTSLWIGDLDPWMTEEYIINMFSNVGSTSAKIIRDKMTGYSNGYGFVEFSSHEAAQKALESYNGQLVPGGQGKVFRLNWGALSTRGPRGGAEYSIFVGEIGPEVTDAMLMATFSRYPNLKSAKVMTAGPGISKGYAFVRFYDEEERNRALAEMQGVVCGSRAMKLNVAQDRKQTNQAPQQIAVPQQMMPSYYPEDPAFSPHNTTLYVGNVTGDIANEDTLRKFFTPYGQISSIRVPVGKGFAFISFATHSEAESALVMNNQFIGSSKVKVTWGRPNTKGQYAPSNVGGGSYSSYPSGDSSYASSSMQYPQHSQIQAPSPQSGPVKDVEVLQSFDLASENEKFISNHPEPLNIYYYNSGFPQERDGPSIVI
eukprot:TRINITY_DN2118_c0_g1_i2.p1 TRINITY_DN2118_c0_g1~~TRINITY_DN2118_c0_g1_i2.p1  ORF type:complete len:381 (-),score=87.22 TRINITY_DN2118_c0_g1_i2:43-1185(-)